MSNQNSRPVGVAIRELRDNLIKVVQDSGLDLSVVVLVLRDMTQQVAEAESRQILLWQQQNQKESSPEERDE